MDNKTELLQKVLETEERDFPGELTAEQEQSVLYGNPHVVHGTVQVYREYAPKRDEVEYTIFFRCDGDEESTVKLRTGFILTLDEINAMSDDEIGFLIRVFIRSRAIRYRRESYLARTSG